MKEKVIGLIPARMGSSRFPGKPIHMINGFPMIYWVYNQAKKCELIDKIYVVTEDEKIKIVCKEYGIPCMYKKVQVTGGAERIACASDDVDGDIYLNIQGDEPLLEPDALTQIIEEMTKNKKENYVGLYSLIQTEEEFKDRNVVKVVLDNDNHAMYFSRSCIPERFEYGYAYRVMGLYGYRKNQLEKFKNIKRSNIEILESGIEMIRMLEAGCKIKFVRTNYNSIGVDLPEHIEKVEKIMKKNMEKYR